MHRSITIYGTQTCDDTERTRAFLVEHRVPFQEIDIDTDPAAEGFVLFINHGFRSTPTLILETDQPNLKMIITEPTDQQLHEIFMIR